MAQNLRCRTRGRGARRHCRLAAQQAPDRSKPPVPGPAPALTLPAVQKATLANGLRVWLLEHHEVPLVQANLVVLSGASADVPGQFGAASMTAAMLDEGAAGKAALALADEVEFLGAQLSTAASFDASAMRMSTPAAKLPAALGLLADVALAPDFPADELERLRTERLTSLLQARDEPASLAGIAFPRLLYGPEHRYGTSPGGTESSLKALGVGELRTFHRGHYRPDNAVLIVVGDVTLPTLRPLVEQRFGTLESGRPGRAAVPGARRRRSRASARSTSSTSRAPRSRRSASDWSACRAPRPTTSPSTCWNTDPRRLVHLAPQHQPAREERLLLRRDRRASTCARPPVRSSPPPACRPTRPPTRSRSSSTS